MALPADSKQPATKTVAFKEFLEKIPPGRPAIVEHLAQVKSNIACQLFLPVLALYCDSDQCRGVRLFDESSGPVYGGAPGQLKDVFVTFRCRNCEESEKTYALRVRFMANQIPELPQPALLDGEVIKFGEFPPFGPPTPARLITLLGPDKDYYLKGRRAENQGMGVGAFGYYRRVVESQKNRLLDEIIRVGETIGVRIPAM